MLASLRRKKWDSVTDIQLSHGHSVMRRRSSQCETADITNTEQEENVQLKKGEKE